jgi:hypothetical protein
VDTSDAGHDVRVLSCLERSIQDARVKRHGVRRVASRQLTEEERSLVAGVLKC